MCMNFVCTASTCQPAQL